MTGSEPFQPGPDGRWACRADRVFDGRSAHARSAVVIEGETIAAVVPADAVPAGVPVLAADGCTVLPGLIDTHVHFMPWQGPIFLAFGVTTVRDTGNPLDWILRRRAGWKDRPCPRIVCLGPLLDGFPPTWSVSMVCRTLDSAVRAVAEVARAGVDGIKLYVGLPPEWIGPMVREAHARGLPVAAHRLSGAVQAGEAGVDELFHLDGLLDDIWPDRPPGWLEVWGHPGFATTGNGQQRAADRIGELGVACTPTLAYWESRRRTACPDYPPPQAVAWLPGELVEILRGWPESQPDPAAAEAWKRALAAAQRFVGMLIRRGCRILPGTDVPFGYMTPGRSLWHELSLLVECGMTPLAALRSATADAAALLRRPNVGRLVTGFAADLVVVRGDPVAAIPEDPQIVATVSAGRLYRPAELLQPAGDSAPHAGLGPWGAEFRKRAQAT